MALQIGALLLLAPCPAVIGAEAHSQAIAELNAPARPLRPWEGRVPAPRRTPPSPQRTFAQPAASAALGLLRETRATSREFGVFDRTGRRYALSHSVSAVFALAGPDLQADGRGADVPAAIDASRAEAGEEAGEGEGGQGFSGGRAEFVGYRSFVPSSPASLSLEERVSRIEGYLPHLATRADLLATKADLLATQEALRADLGREIAKNGKAIADLRVEVEEKLGEQFRDFLLIISVMLSALGGLQLLVVKYMLLPGDGEAPRQGEKSA